MLRNAMTLMWWMVGVSKTLYKRLGWGQSSLCGNIGQTVVCGHWGMKIMCPVNSQNQGRCQKVQGPLEKSSEVSEMSHINSCIEESNRMTDLKSRVGSNAKSTQKMHTAPRVSLVKYRISINKSNPMSIWKKKNENLSKISPKNVIVLPNGQHALSNTVIPWAKSQCWR